MITSLFPGFGIPSLNALLAPSLLLPQAVRGLGAGETVSLGQTLGGRAQFTGATLVMRSSTPSLVANAILNTRPTGLLTAATLDGR